jgi:hypothetical protein
MFIFVTMSASTFWRLLKWTAGIVAVLVAIGALLNGLGFDSGSTGSSAPISSSLPARNTIPLASGAHWYKAPISDFARSMDDGSADGNTIACGGYYAGHGNCWYIDLSKANASDTNFCTDAAYVRPPGYGGFNDPNPYDSMCQNL